MRAQLRRIQSYNASQMLERAQQQFVQLQERVRSEVDAKKKGASEQNALFRTYSPLEVHQLLTSIGESLEQTAQRIQADANRYAIHDTYRYVPASDEDQFRAFEYWR